MADQPPPWDIGRPQPVFARLADQGLLGGAAARLRLRDRGEHHDGGRARRRRPGRRRRPDRHSEGPRKAAERGSAARFEVADVLELGQLGRTFDTVVDSGVFHVFDDEDRIRYVASLATVMRPGATCYLMCFSDRQPGRRPRRVSPAEMTAAFRDGWDVRGISAETFAINFRADRRRRPGWPRSSVPRRSPAGKAQAARVPGPPPTDGLQRGSVSRVGRSCAFSAAGHAGHRAHPGAPSVTWGDVGARVPTGATVAAEG